MKPRICCTPIILALKILMQEDHAFDARLGYLGRFFLKKERTKRKEKEEREKKNKKKEKRHMPPNKSKIILIIFLLIHSTRICYSVNNVSGITL